MVSLFSFLEKLVVVKVEGIYRSHLGYIVHWITLKCEFQANGVQIR